MAADVPGCKHVGGVAGIACHFGSVVRLERGGVVGIMLNDGEVVLHGQHDQARKRVIVNGVWLCVVAHL